MDAPAGLELGAVFWADKLMHTENRWKRHPKTFTFRLENIPASQILELLSTELKLGYEIDSCGENPVSLVGHDMHLQQIVESVEVQAGAAIQFDGKVPALKCQTDQLRVGCQTPAAMAMG